ncbi:MAG: MFS transporter [Coriobacteriia bacterium]|nr:MFS transporter [Coriobacteriia bacterium]
MGPTAEESGWIPRRSSVIAWVLYDLANTTFALGVGSRYFGPWLIEDRGGADWQLSATIVAAMIAVIILGPWIGALSDHHGTRRPYLVGSTLVCVGATALLATWGIVPSLVFYAIGTVGFHSGAVVYDALLPDVSTPESAGRISGLGVAIGYTGSALALGIGMYLLPRAGYAAVFRCLALAFLLFALPAFFGIRERPRPRREGRPPGLLDSPGTMVRAWRTAARYPGVIRFLIGRFLYTDAINTVFLFNAVFAKLELGFTDSQTDRLALLGIVCAGLGAVVAGRAVDSVGPKRVLEAALYSQLAGLVAAITAALTGVQGIGWLVAVGGGVGIGAAWASDRVLMTRLAPEHLMGEFFGLYATVGRFATVLGPLVWALITDGLDWGRTAALAFLGLSILLARVVIRGVDDSRGVGNTGTAGV